MSVYLQCKQLLYWGFEEAPHVSAPKSLRVVFSRGLSCWERRVCSSASTQRGWGGPERCRAAPVRGKASVREIWDELSRLWERDAAQLMSSDLLNAHKAAAHEPGSHQAQPNCSSRNSYQQGPRGGFG